MRMESCIGSTSSLGAGGQGEVFLPFRAGIGLSSGSPGVGMGGATPAASVRQAAGPFGATRRSSDRAAKTSAYGVRGGVS